MKKIILGTLFIICFISIKAQGIIQGYIINIEDNKAYLDVTSPKVEIGDVLSVYSDAGYMIHPVTKQKIKKEGSIIADLEVIEVNNEYSVATIYPQEAVTKLKAGMIAQMPELTPEMKEMMKEEQEAISEAQAKEIEAASNNPENFTTAEQVLQWHLKSTGLDKMAANPPRSYLVETRQTTLSKKGKEVSVIHITRIADIPSSRIYTKADVTLIVPLSKDIKTSSSSVISNGIGWVKTGKKKPKRIDNDMVRDAIKNLDIVKDFTCKGYTCTLCGNTVIDGKSCFELEFSYPGKDNVKSCIDKNTGLLVAKSSISESKKIGIRKVKVEKTPAVEKVISYRQYGDYTLPFITQSGLENELQVKTEMLQFIPNYQINDSQFSLEALNMK